jgi:hypothetical protein
VARLANENLGSIRVTKASSVLSAVAVSLSVTGEPYTAETTQGGHRGLGGCPPEGFTGLQIYLVSVRKVLESYESDVIQGSYRRMEGKANVDIRKPRFL